MNEHENELGQHRSEYRERPFIDFHSSEDRRLLATVVLGSALWIAAGWGLGPFPDPPDQTLTTPPVPSACPEQ